MPSIHYLAVTISRLSSPFFLQVGNTSCACLLPQVPGKVLSRYTRDICKMNRRKNKIYFQMQCIIKVTFQISGLEVYHSIDDVALRTDWGRGEGDWISYLILHTEINSRWLRNLM